MDLNEEFTRLDKFYRDDKFDKIFKHEFGAYFLKMRSISRPDLLLKLGSKINLNTQDIPKKKLFKLMFCLNIPIEVVDEFIREIYIQLRADRLTNEENLYNELYKLKSFDWGGFYQNNVEKTIVNNYIKKVKRYEELCNKVDNELSPRLKCYTLCSWYNHWTSILIEDMVKDTPEILPSVGLIKKIDFFWKNFPFDLKVTYFPEEFMALKRKELGLKPEFTELKAFARSQKIPFDRRMKKRELITDLITKISEDISSESKEFIRTFHSNRQKIIKKTIEKPYELKKWFYEYQGERRFAAENRFFIVLIDLKNLDDSWKLKRNKNLLLERINHFFSNNINVNFEEMKFSFNFKDEEYTTHATILFIIKK